VRWLKLRGASRSSLPCGLLVVLNKLCPRLECLGHCPRWSASHPWTKGESLPSTYQNLWVWANNGSMWRHASPPPWSRPMLLAPTSNAKQRMPM
jgi:hypothetical protein